MNNIIIETLRKMDVNDDSQWLETGLPRVETVRDIADIQTINRIEIEHACPGFSRSNFTFPEEVSEEPAPTLAIEHPETVIEQIIEPETIKTFPDKNTISDLENAKARLSARENLLLERRAEVDAANKKLEQAAEAVSEAAAEVENLTPRTANQMVIAQYLDSQKKESEKRAVAQKELIEKGLTKAALKAIQKTYSKAPIDQARIK